MFVTGAITAVSIGVPLLAVGARVRVDSPRWRSSDAFAARGRC